MSDDTPINDDDLVHLPEALRKKIGRGIRKAYESPAARKRLRDSWTPARRAAMSLNRRKYFAAMKADPVKSAEYGAKISAGRQAELAHKRAAKEQGNVSPGRGS